MRRQILEASRKRKEKKRNLKIILACFLFVLFVVGAVSLFYISKFRIKEITITGNEIVEKEKILSLAQESIKGKIFYIFPKDNIFLISKDEIKNSLLNNFLRIKSVSVFKDLPNTLLVKIEERNPVSLYCKENNCAFINEDGLVFEEAPFFSGSLFVKFFDEREGNNFLVKKQILETEQYKNLIEFCRLALRDDIRISEITLKKEGLYQLNTTEGWYIMFNERNQLDIAIENLRITLENQIKDERSSLEYIDLRLENKVFYKFK